MITHTTIAIIIVCVGLLVISVILTIEDRRKDN